MLLLIFSIVHLIFNGAHGWEKEEMWPDLPYRGEDSRWFKWYCRRVMAHMELMTEEINKQVFQKLKHGEKYVELDDETNVYMMGKMSESMKETFKSMIMTYKLYNKYSDIKRGRIHVIEKQLAGLTLLEASYNRLLLERREYHKAMQGYYEELMISSKKAEDATRMEEMYRRAVGRTPLIPDDDYKMQLRKQKFEEKKASFNPEAEGIDIDLGDAVKYRLN